MAESKVRTLSVDFEVQILNLVKYLKTLHLRYCGDFREFTENMLRSLIFCLTFQKSHFILTV